jgi:hypothetical protein
MKGSYRLGDLSVCNGLYEYNGQWRPGWRSMDIIHLDWLDWLVMMGWAYVHLRMIAVWTMVWWYRLGLTPNSSTRALWQQLSGGPISRDIFAASRRMDEENENLVYSSPWDFKRSLTCRKILRQGTSGFTSHPKEGVLRIFIVLKNPSPWPGSKPWPLGSLASILTTIRPRRLTSVAVTVGLHYTGPSRDCS